MTLSFCLPSSECTVTLPSRRAGLPSDPAIYLIQLSPSDGAFFPSSIPFFYHPPLLGLIRPPPPLFLLLPSSGGVFTARPLFEPGYACLSLLASPGLFWMRNFFLSSLRPVRFGRESWYDPSSPVLSPFPQVFGHRLCVELACFFNFSARYPALPPLQ